MHKFIITDRIPQTTTPNPNSRIGCYSNNTRVFWGEDDNYPQFLYDLYTNQSLLGACIDSSAAISEFPELFKSLAIYGLAPIRLSDNVLLDARFFRMNTSRSNFWYKTPTSRSYTQYTSKDVLLLSLDYANVYPTPFIHRAIQATQTLLLLSQHGLSQAANGFSSSALISLNNGVPDPDTQDEIESLFNSKFTGAENAGRVAIQFASDSDHAATIQTIPVSDYFAQFTAIKEFSESTIYQTFKLTPSLIGFGNSSNFNQEEYDKQFKLFKEFTVSPIDTKIKKQVNAYLDSIHNVG